MGSCTRRVSPVAEPPSRLLPGGKDHEPHHARAPTPAMTPSTPATPAMTPTAPATPMTRTMQSPVTRAAMTRAATAATARTTPGHQIRTVATTARRPIQGPPPIPDQATRPMATTRREILAILARNMTTATRAQAPRPTRSSSTRTAAAKPAAAAPMTARLSPLKPPGEHRVTTAMAEMPTARGKATPRATWKLREIAATTLALALARIIPAMTGSAGDQTESTLWLRPTRAPHPRQVGAMLRECPLSWPRSPGSKPPPGDRLAHRSPSGMATPGPTQRLPGNTSRMRIGLPRRSPPGERERSSPRRSLAAIVR